jgi:hypothetical protein
MRRPMRLPRRVFVILGMLLIAPLTSAHADVTDAAAVLERRVKAALLYRLTNYVEWPPAAFAGPDAPFAIGIAGASLLAAELTEFAAGRRVLNRPLIVYRRARSPDAIRSAQLIFVGRDEAAQLSSIVRSAPPSALIVTESEDGLRNGSVINFIIVDGQVRFEVSLEAAQRRNLRLSSRLLSVAHTVHTGSP